jgi:hypothetical protein
MMVTDSKKLEPPPPCPTCGVRSFLREIIYGEPAAEPDPSHYVMGGCLMDGSNPTFQCLQCDWAGPIHDSENESYIDITFDMRIDAGGRDPDAYSKTLKEYHQILWSKPLPDGTIFNLDSKGSVRYLTHESKAGSFALASDSITHSYKSVKHMASTIDSFDSETIESFRNLGYTIGGFLIFPGNRIDNKMTINGARGLSPMIADRFDLTLECIRLHYRGIDNPLGQTLDRYQDFFAIFESFENYVEFFLLQDLITPASGEIKFFTKNTELFTSSAFPRTGADYLEYRENSMEFLTRRNQRIQDWCHAAPRKIDEDWFFK